MGVEVTNSHLMATYGGQFTLTFRTMGYRRQKRARYSWFRTVAELESEILQLRKALNEARLERDILKKATVDSICQCNTPFNYLFRVLNFSVFLGLLFS